MEKIPSYNKLKENLAGFKKNLPGLIRHMELASKIRSEFDAASDVIVRNVGVSTLSTFKDTSKLNLPEGSRPSN